MHYDSIVFLKNSQKTIAYLAIKMWEVATNLHFMGAKIIGYGRKSSLDTKDYDHVSKYYSTGNLSQFLQNCDYFVNVMPNTNETKGLLNGDVLENCKDKEVVFINIGRGSIISEDSLLNALNKKWLASAILDVFEEEPLRKNSPLWTLSNVLITPHIAGITREKDVAEQFRSNFELYQQNLTIPGAINFPQGY